MRFLEDFEKKSKKAPKSGVSEDRSFCGYQSDLSDMSDLSDLSDGIDHDHRRNRRNGHFWPMTAL